mmetsp:Transcript_90112/g.160487  ORF Transcript_90112/g.160487 Transcript_90112/m.160487 type:complete len:215 (+) Transcript_90112:38-682(+)
MRMAQGGCSLCTLAVAAVGVIALLSWDARGFAEIPAARQSLTRKPLTGSESIQVLSAPTDFVADRKVERCQTFFAAASRFGALALAAACSALPRRRGRNGQQRRRLQGLAGLAVSGMPAGLKAFASTRAAVMLRLTTLNFCKIYMAMLVLRITIMWFPNINPYRQPFYSMIQLTDPYLNLFRGWMPPIFGIDLSVILAFVVIQAVIDGLTINPF